MQYILYLLTSIIIFINSSILVIYQQHLLLVMAIILLNVVSCAVYVLLLTRSPGNIDVYLINEEDFVYFRPCLRTRYVSIRVYLHVCAYR